MSALAANATGAATDSSFTDSIFTWTFTATSGDSWGGSLVEESSRYEVGSTLDTAYGRYTIVAEAAQAGDLSDYGFDEGWIAVAWYRDKGGTWMLTRLGEAAAAGLAGLGSERDAAWTGSAWDSFGLGGADQADPAELADSLFTWTFTYDNGDVLEGTLLADTKDWNPGDTRRTAHGTYRITGETPYGRDLGATGIEGTVRTLRYHDFDADIDFALESGGASPTGHDGLGSEADRAWNGSAWQQVGEGGALVADRRPDRLFEWRFEATGGDKYLGTFIGHSTAWSTGEVLETEFGRYVILGGAAYAGTVAQQGVVWVTGYYDASMRSWLPVQGGAGGSPSGLRGLGSELDFAWNGVAWDDFGHGGAERASIARASLFTWFFTADSGDVYGGWLVEDDERYQPGDSFRLGQGSYRIDSETSWTGSAAKGTVWTAAYYDKSADAWLQTYDWGTLGGQASGADGLGSEADQAWDGNEWDWFGHAGADLAGVTRSARFTWFFTAGNGDTYGGWLIDDASRYRPGDVIPLGAGSYRIDDEVAWAGGEPRGTIWTAAYHDASADRWLQTRNWATLGGQPSGIFGLGSETDQAWDGDEWDWFGSAGADLASVTRSALFTWFFTADSGDVYGGWLVEAAGRHAPGDVVRLGQGSYRIDSEAAWTGDAARGTVWTLAYYDKPTDAWLQTWNWGTRGGQPSGTGGLGSELDQAWTGVAWDRFGQAGADLADALRHARFTWFFTAGNGDTYGGWLIDEASRYRPGDVFDLGQGSYRIDDEVAWTGDEAPGTLWTAAYYDSSADRWLQTWNWGTRGGQPSGTAGLGSERDQAWDGNEWDWFGSAGADLATVTRSARFTWFFTAGNGDVYGGWLIDGADRYKPGDLVSLGQGSYRIDDETAWTGSEGRGTVWTAAYFDKSAGAWLQTYAWGTLGGQPSGTAGLGSESDLAWNGSAWLAFGHAAIASPATVGAAASALFG